MLFDEILEQHTVRSLQRALASRGHQVTATGPVWKGHLLPKTDSEIGPIAQRVDSICRAAPDVLFNFRPSSLLPEMVGQLKAAGIHTVVWLADDPVLYGVCYRSIIEAYDTVLHCGGEIILSFYQRHHAAEGFNFPFWTDDQEFRYAYNPAQAEFDVVFLGNCDGAIRSGRYELLSSLPFKTRIYGKVKKDPYRLCAGYLETTTETSDMLRKARCAISIPQKFADYKGTAYDFPGLADLGHFELPSRVVQYAAAGLPVVSLEGREPPPIFPELIACSDRDELVFKVEALLEDEARLRDLSAATHARFRHGFSAAARAAFLESLVTSPQRWRGLSAAQRAVCAVGAGVEQPRHPGPGAPAIQEPRSAPAGVECQVLPSVDEQRRTLRSNVFECPHKWRILHFGTDVNGETDIVACMRRALVHLGHTVLHIDFRRHKEIVSNPRESVTGLGPVFISLQRVQHLVDRFHPQIIICNAGGLCFSEEDSEELRARGILLLGITLSDPDVQQTVIGHAGLFDFHTTNSVLALERYLEAGINNTLLFPFGIDCGYLTTEVRPAPEFQADVICMGHALHRPERQRTMERLAREFKVRAYGLGWNLPGAERVTGQRMIQASRAGRIHVNFANTLGHYVNVKVGVFESIGNGAVLCTQRFPEMERYFSYGDEIVGFESEDDLCARIHELLADESQYEKVRRRAFQRLVSEHLYEHRWRDVFTKIETDICEEQMMVSRHRARKLQDTLAATSERPRRIVVSGFFGARNTGDELILRAMIEGVSSERKNIQLIVASEQPATVERLHGCPAFQRSDVAAMDAEMSVASAAVLGGGGLWHDYTFERSGGPLSIFSDTVISLAGFGKLLILAGIYGRPAHVFGIGVGPLSNPQAKQLLRLLAETAQTIAVRDQESKDLLEMIESWRVPVTYVPDMVYSLNLGNPRAPAAIREIESQCPIIAVNLRPWPTGKQAVEERVAQALEVVARLHDCALVGIPMQAKHDEEILRRAFAMIRIPRPSLVLDWTEDLEELVGTIKASRGLLAMRLHACLLGHRLGVPTLGIAYDPKVAGHFKELGVEERALPYEASVDDLVSGLTQLVNSQGKLEAAVCQRVASLEEAARGGVSLLARQLAEAPLICGALPIRRITADSRAWESMKHSIAYQLGDTIIRALSRPGRDAIILPYRLVRLAREASRRRARR